MPSRTEARSAKQRLRMPPGDYRHCACSRLYSLSGSSLLGEISQKLLDLPCCTIRWATRMLGLGA
jgi:hypothetical protein